MKAPGRKRRSRSHPNRMGPSSRGRRFRSGAAREEWRQRRSAARRAVRSLGTRPDIFATIADDAQRRDDCPERQRAHRVARLVEILARSGDACAREVRVAWRRRIEEQRGVTARAREADRPISLHTDDGRLRPLWDGRRFVGGAHVSLAHVHRTALPRSASAVRVSRLRGRGPRSRSRRRATRSRAGPSSADESSSSDSDPVDRATRRSEAWGPRP